MSSQPGHKATISVLLERLETLGKYEQAQRLKARVLTQFSGVLTEEQILALPLETVVGILDIYTLLGGAQPPKPADPYQTRVRELKAQGYNVIFGRLNPSK